jgi:2-polyprenyl-3-methyl-5-hydroxy-6-metoxy-1,4-benzoquinol methylase
MLHYDHSNHQSFERSWWGDCSKTYGEETKQLTYANRMGMVSTEQDGRWPIYDLRGKSILDLGGGPSSMLLKTVNGNRLTVVDPCKYPEWVFMRYDDCGIEYGRCYAEDFDTTARYDEAWIYNVLQHVRDPERIIKNAFRLAKVIRIFEWIDIPPHLGHPHELSEIDLDIWLKGKGKTEIMTGENSCVGRAYYGVFSCASM